MKRRSFIQQSAQVSLALPLLGVMSCEAEHKPNYKMGLQLFTVRDAMEKDPLATLKALKQMGYEDFESYGYDAKNKLYYGFSPKEFKTVLDDLNLSTSSGHYGVNGLMEVSEDELNAYVDSCIEGALELEDSYIVYPSLAQIYHSLEGYQLLVQKLNQIGRRIHEAGLGFAYHNFGGDFVQYGDKMGIDWIIQETNPDWVKLEVDFYWVMHAGVIKPKEFIAKAMHRTPLWHIKDMHKVSRDYTEMGQGSIDYTTMLPSASDSGLEYFYIEQGGNFAVNSMQSVKTSIDYVKSNITIPL